MIRNAYSRRFLASKIQERPVLWSRTMSTSFSKPNWATADPDTMGTNSEPHQVSNLVGGKWMSANSEMLIPHPMDKSKHPIFSIPNTSLEELGPFLESMQKVPKSGVHNPLKKVSSFSAISRKNQPPFLIYFLFPSRNATWNTERLVDKLVLL